MKTKAVVFKAKGVAELEELELAELAPDEVLLTTEVSLISPGTETRIFQHGHPTGSFPMVPGYIAVARVEKAGEGVRDFAQGDLVYAAGGNRLKEKEVIPLWGGHSQKVIFGANRLIKLGSKSSSAEYAFSKLLAISLRGVHLSDTAPGEKVVVIGLGMIGQFCVRGLLARGAEVVACDPSRTRRSFAEKMGVTVMDPADCDIVKAVKEKWADGTDVVFDCTGRVEQIQTGIHILKARNRDFYGKAPRLVLQANYTDPIVFDHRSAYDREIQFIFTRDNTKEDFLAAVRMIEEGIIKADDFITSRFYPGDAQKAYDDLLYDKDAHLTCFFDWSLVKES